MLIYFLSHCRGLLRMSHSSTSLFGPVCWSFIQNFSWMRPAQLESSLSLLPLASSFHGLIDCTFPPRMLSTWLSNFGSQNCQTGSNGYTPNRFSTHRCNWWHCKFAQVLPCCGYVYESPSQFCPPPSDCSSLVSAPCYHSLFLLLEKRLMPSLF